MAAGAFRGARLRCGVGGRGVLAGVLLLLVTTIAAEAFTEAEMEGGLGVLLAQALLLLLAANHSSDEQQTQERTQHHSCSETRHPCRRLYQELPQDNSSPVSATRCAH